MSDASVWVGLAGALGGAAITAVAGVVVANRQRHSAGANEAARLVRESSERAAAQRQSDVRAEVDRLVGLRIGGRLWMDALLRFQQTMRTGRSVDLEAFDTAIAEAGGQLIELGYANPYSPTYEVERYSAQVHDQLAGLTSSTRQLVLDFERGIPEATWERIRSRMEHLAQTRMELLNAMDAHARTLLRGEEPLRRPLGRVSGCDQSEGFALMVVPDPVDHVA
ncbi:hypothetical protein ACH4A7_37575 [Streptomyces cyaneofuscatus]|uniref:hypothetical protein n=1 Tax=Streptomyces cyaneofuscatus TaxID=66883 RepID=UPI0037A3AA52